MNIIYNIPRIIKEKIEDYHNMEPVGLWEHEEFDRLCPRISPDTVGNKGFCLFSFVNFNQGK